MRIINIIENTAGKNDCIPEHGLCFYVETKKHKILVDTGASGLLVENADQLGIDLADVDTVVITHGGPLQACLHQAQPQRDGHRVHRPRLRRRRGRRHHADQHAPWDADRYQEAQAGDSQ